MNNFTSISREEIDNSICYFDRFSTALLNCKEINLEGLEKIFYLGHLEVVQRAIITLNHLGDEKLNVLYQRGLKIPQSVLIEVNRNHICNLTYLLSKRECTINSTDNGDLISTLIAYNSIRSELSPNGENTSFPVPKMEFKQLFSLT